MSIEEIKKLISSFDFVVGIDEVGRGSIAGPMFVCSVVLHRDSFIDGVKDSKLLSPSKRQKLLPKIVNSVRDIGIGVVSNKEIDKFGMSISLRLAIIRSLCNLKFLPSLLITDYVNIKDPKFSKFLEVETLPKKEKYLNLYSKIVKFDKCNFFNGDIGYLSIKKADRYIQANSMASIVAKVLRDRYMVHISNKYPWYGFNKNKGYATKDHIEAIKNYGLSDVHRTSFVIKDFHNT